MKLSEFYDNWISLRSSGLAPSSKYGYNVTFYRHIDPVCGFMELQEVTPSDVLRCISPLCAENHTRAAQLTLILMRALYKDAILMGVCSFNPAATIKMPKHRPRETKFWPPPTIRAFLAAQRFSPYYAIWCLALCCGLRRGELLALQWSDIDFDAAILHVRHQRVLVDGITHDTPPKSAAGRRDLPISPQLLRILHAHRRAQPTISSYVLADPEGRPFSAKRLAKVFRKACVDSSVPPITLHGLRHSMATAAAIDGTPIKALQHILGHSHFSTTADIYTHVDQSQMRSALDELSCFVL